MTVRTIAAVALSSLALAACGDSENELSVPGKPRNELESTGPVI